MDIHNIVKNKKYFFGLIYIFIGILMIYRCFFGIEITDEAYYVAEAKTVLEGNVPYIYDTNISVGFTFLMLPFIFIYKTITHGYAGLFLYMRICFSLCRLFILFVIYKFLKEYFDDFCVSCAVLVLEAYSMYSIQNFSYNTISFYLSLLASVLLFHAARVEKRKSFFYCVAGILSGLAVFSHPVQIIVALWFTFIIFIFEEKKSFSLCYIVGGLLQCFIVFIPLLLMNGPKKIRNGIAATISQGTTLKNTLLSDIISSIGDYYGFILTSFIVLFAVSMYFLLYLSIKKGILISAQNTFIYALLFSIIIELVIIFQKENSTICWNLGFLVFITFFFVVILDFKESYMYYFGFPWIIFMVLLAKSAGGVEDRFVYMVPVVLTLFIYIEKFVKGMDTIDTKIMKSMLLVMTAVFILCEFKSLTYVYRDDLLGNLKCKVQEGVYKGIYTVGAKASDIVQLEDYIKQKVSKEDYVSFRDNVPAGYLLSEGKICDIRTWDDMQYSYGLNNPDNLYSYYFRRNHIPDKIIYIDYGRDSCLSIEDESFLYNKFVNEYYDKIEDINLNSTFKRVLVYKIRDGISYEFNDTEVQ